MSEQHFSKAITIFQQPVERLRPHPQNPRIHSKKQLQQLIHCIQKFKYIAPILVDENNRIIAGHARWMAARELGEQTVSTICLSHLSEAQIKALMIADNKLAENAQWNEELLAQLFKEISSEVNLDFSVDITGFEMGEVDAIIEDAMTPPDEVDPEDDIPDISGLPAVSKTGDLWIMGTHRIYCGNSLEDESFDTVMQGQQADMVFIDPPYNVAINGHVSGLGTIRHREFEMASGEMTQAEFTTFLKGVVRLLVKHTTDGSIHYICIDWRHMGELLAAGQDSYAELKNLCVWVKDNGGMGAFYRSRHELVFAFKNGTAAHKNNFLLGQHGRYRTNVWEYPGANSFSRHSDEGNMLQWHPTPKPVAMIADAIMDCTNRNDLVLDCFLGSGSTLIAAERTGRVCIGIEIDPFYVDTTIRRWQKMTGQQAVHAVTGKLFDAEVAHV